MSRTSHTPDAFTRVAACGVVPAVAVGAHATASGEMPGSGGVVLAAAIGLVAAGLLEILTRGRRLWPATAAAVAALTSAQVAIHGALAADATHVAHGGAPVGMLVTHLVAIPVSALLIVVGAQLLAVVGSVVRSLTSPTIARVPASVLLLRTQSPAAAGPAVGGAGVRGPPAGD